MYPLKKISRAKFLKAYPHFPTTNNYHNRYSYPDVYDSCILFVESNSTRGLCNNIARELTALLKSLKYEQIVFMGDINAPWLYRDHPYKPVKEALEYLSANNISKTFSGAIKLDVNSSNFNEFVKHVFWLVRCNGVVFIPYFSDPEFNIIGSICQYGNIHLSILNAKTDLLFNDSLKNTSFTITDKSKCTGRIYERRAVI